MPSVWRTPLSIAQNWNSFENTFHYIISVVGVLCWFWVYHINIIYQYRIFIIITPNRGDNNNGLFSICVEFPFLISVAVLMILWMEPSLTNSICIAKCVKLLNAWMNNIIIVYIMFVLCLSLSLIFRLKNFFVFIFSRNPHARIVV